MSKIIIPIQVTNTQKNLRYIGDVPCNGDYAQVFLDVDGNLVFHWRSTGVQVSASLNDIGTQIKLLVQEK